jgi:hypothetical protein
VDSLIADRRFLARLCDSPGFHFIRFLLFFILEGRLRDAGTNCREDFKKTTVANRSNVFVRDGKYK